MKRILYAAAVATLILNLASCDDAFMDEKPQVNITVPGFFNTVTDLQMIVNGFYQNGYMPNMPYPPIRDADSDNVTGPGHNSSADTWAVVFGTKSAATGGWGDWSALKSINVLLDNAGRVEGNAAEIANYVGIARYCRANWYINMVKQYSHVPWIEHAIASDDPDVYRGSDPREFVVDKIMEDLEYAVANISATMGNKTRVHKYCALMLLSNFCLYEGTFRKYHPELNLASTADRFLTRAISASEEIMNSGQFAIAATSKKDIGHGMFGSPAFRDLFASYKLDGNKEIIQWVDNPENVRSGESINPEHYGLSRSLQESFLTADGKPFSTVPGYATMPYYDVFKNRDPRLTETFCHPGSVTYVSDRTAYPYKGEAYDNPPTKGGYCQEKFEANRASVIRSHYEGRPIFRYAEVLLNYAEAKAELGSFYTADADRSINLLRNRVGMPSFDAAREVDDILRNQYPGISDDLRAIRRERRVELACEGRRQTDIYRWGVGERFKDIEARQGIYVPQFGGYDSSGDGTPNYAIVQKESDIPEDWGDIAKNGVKGWYYFEEDPSIERGQKITSFTLSEGTHGYIVGIEPAPRDFRSPRDYYRPIHVDHFVLNPNLQQAPGW